MCQKDTKIFSIVLCAKHKSQYFNPIRANVPYFMEANQLILKNTHLQLYKI